jgi:hypothetical protein
VRWVEEPTLKRSFPDDFRRYAKNVHRWVPRPTPWTPEVSDERPAAAAKGPSRAAREDRLADALRQNLKRRKAAPRASEQASDRKQTPK